MKDTIITRRRKKTELRTLLVCFILANLCNVYAIIEYKTPWSELFWSLGFVVAAALVFYAVWTAIRLLFFLFKGLSARKRRV